MFVDGIDANVELVAQGLAWHYAKYSGDVGLAEVEAAAQGA